VYSTGPAHDYRTRQHLLRCDYEPNPLSIDRHFAGESTVIDTLISACRGDERRRYQRENHRQLGYKAWVRAAALRRRFLVCGIGVLEMRESESKPECVCGIESADKQESREIVVLRRRFLAPNEDRLTRRASGCVSLGARSAGSSSRGFRSHALPAARLLGAVVIRWIARGIVARCIQDDRSG